VRGLRNKALLAVCLALAALGLAACGSSDGDGTGETVAVSAEEGALPVTVEHKYGATTIEEPPERVVVAGLREQDALLALGIPPVATTEWYGEHPGAIFPWAEDELGDAPLPEVLDFSDGLQFEKIAAQRPDLIVAVYSGLSQADYDKLSKIAPTIAQPRGQTDWGASWQDEITIVGEAVGKPAEAQELLKGAEAEIAAAAEAHPELAGKTGVVGTYYEGLYVYGPEDPRTKLFEDLGFTFPAELNDIGQLSGEEFGGVVPDEQASALDVDALLWFANPGPAQEIREHPVYSGLDVSKEGRDIFLAEKGAFYDSTSFISVLSMPTLLGGLMPKLEAAVDGNPATLTS
jgi:iron complex transport system substrate-binding protein